MIEWCIIITLIGEVLFFTRLDKIVYGTWITPICLLAVPYTVIVVIAFFCAPMLGYIPLYVESVWIWIFGLFFFWLPGQIVMLLLSKKVRASVKKSKFFFFEKESEKIVLILSCITITLLCYGLFVSLKSLGFYQIATDEFAKSYGYGIIGHVKNFSMSLFVFLIGTACRKNIVGLIVIIIFFVLYLMYPVKSWLIIPVLAGAIYRFSTGRPKLSVLKVIVITFFVFSIFVMSYLVEFGVKSTDVFFNYEVYRQLASHFAGYLFSGVLSLGDAVRMGIGNLNGDSQVIFAPFLNIYAIITSGQIISSITYNFSFISLYDIDQSNVHTLFGTLLINLGIFPSIIYVICFGVFVYGLFVFANITNNCWIGIAWSFIAIILLLGWFDFYLKSLPFVEVPVYCAVLAIVQRQRMYREKVKGYQ